MTPNQTERKSVKKYKETSKMILNNLLKVTISFWLASCGGAIENTKQNLNDAKIFVKPFVKEYMAYPGYNKTLKYIKSNPEKINGFDEAQFGKIDDLQFTDKFKVNFERKDANSLIIWINLVNKNDESKTIYLKTTLHLSDLEFDRSRNSFFTQDTQLGIIANKLNQIDLDKQPFSFTTKLN